MFDEIKLGDEIMVYTDCRSETLPLINSEYKWVDVTEEKTQKQELFDKGNGYVCAFWKNPHQRVMRCCKR